MLRWGRFVARHRWLVLIASLLGFAATLEVVLLGGSLVNSQKLNVESAHGATLQAKEIHSAPETLYRRCSRFSARASTGWQFRGGAGRTLGPVGDESLKG